MIWRTKTIAKMGNAGQINRRHYKNLYCAFDIETTRIKELEQSIMYVWQFDILQGNEHFTIIGRTWEEFKLFTDNIAHELRENETLLIFVHLLSYEFCFLKGIFDILPENVFCTDSRKVLKLQLYKRKLEFRCSYILTDVALDYFCEQMSTNYRKLEGYDYDKLRYPWTALTQEEYQYCINDVRGLTEAVKNRNIATDDDLSTMPLTLTGYARRDARRAMHCAGVGYREMFPSLPLYKMLMQASRGGNASANRRMVGFIFQDVKCWDRVSSYADIIVNSKFPMHRFKKVEDPNLDKVNDLLARNKALLLTVHYIGLSLVDSFEPFPYISVNKEINGKPEHDVMFDMGRLLQGSITLTLTDIDFKIIAEEYDWRDIEILDLYETSYNYLPIQYRSLVIAYFREKCAFKNSGNETEYNIKKEKVSSLYGMMAQNMLKEHIIYRQDVHENGGFVPDGKTEEQRYEEYLRKGFLPYQWGIWVQSWGRFWLEQAIRIVKKTPDAMCLYCDTDSIKYIGDVNFAELNKQISTQARKNGMVGTDAIGIEHCSGVYEFEQTYEKFVTLGCKKYAYELDGKTIITVAGIPKERGSEVLVEMGGIKTFKDGTVFEAAKVGKNQITYNDNVAIHYVVDGHELTIKDNCVIAPADYKISLTLDYMKILLDTRTVTNFTLDQIEE